MMLAVGKKHGIPDCRPHRLRDTCAVRWLVNGVPIGDVSKLLGHSNVHTTETYYARWIPARALRLLGIVEALRTERKETGESSRKVVVKKPKLQIA
jgi:integrase